MVFFCVMILLDYQLGAEPNYEDYAFATRHGGRDIQAKGKSNIGTRFKFPTQVSSYGQVVFFEYVTTF